MDEKTNLVLSPRTKIEWMLCQDQMRALLMDYMDFEDIIKLGYVSRSLNAAIDRESNWRYLFRSFYDYSWKRVFRFCYDDYYRCNYSYMLNGTNFVCAGSPVYKHTRCVKCKGVWHMCRYCATRDIQNRSMCNLCDEWRGLCNRCAGMPLLPYDTPPPVFITCFDCGDTHCRDHFSQLPSCDHWICDNCIDKVDFVYLGAEVSDRATCKSRIHIIPPREVHISLRDLYEHEDQTIYGVGIDDLA